MKNNHGFIALIAVIILATGTLAFSLSVMSAAASYADMVNKREFRLQAELNATACLDSVSMMAAKDYFLSGSVHLSEFGCDANVTNDFNGNVNILAQTEFNGISVWGNREINI